MARTNVTCAGSQTGGGGGGTPPDEPEPFIQFSASGDRSSPQALNGATVFGGICVFLNPDTLTPISRVDFYLDGVSLRSESTAPFDFQGSAIVGGNDIANAWDSTAVANGSHTIRMDAITPSGTWITIASFTVQNVVEPDPGGGGTGVTIWVDKDNVNASNSRTRTTQSESAPFLSIQSAANVALAGDQIFVKTSTTPYPTFSITNRSMTDFVTLRGYPLGTRVDVNRVDVALSDRWRFRGFRFTAPDTQESFEIRSSSFIEFENFETVNRGFQPKAVTDCKWENGIVRGGLPNLPCSESQGLSGQGYGFRATALDNSRLAVTSGGYINRAAGFRRCTFRNLEITACSQDGMQFGGDSIQTAPNVNPYIHDHVTDILIEECVFHHNTRYCETRAQAGGGIDTNGDHVDCIQILGTGGPFTIRRCVFHTSQTKLIIKDGHSDTVLVENNLFISGASDGHTMECWDTGVGAERCRIVNNTFVRLGETAGSTNFWSCVSIRHLASQFPGGAMEVELRNNVIHRQTQDGTLSDGVAPTVTKSNNIIKYAGGLNLASNSAEATFVNRGTTTVQSDGTTTHGYELASGSRGVNEGTTLGAPSQDRLARNRVGISPDCGCHERQT
jgi:hypothetical protein